ncbi:MAG TPA: PTS system mannose/fructose/sorbose family transporter subunit IID [Candidatus Krumholzibacteria bacterium]|jgi:PTS system mannose-specific IID component|nr:PTS system mannose/fructose/sorbose family transporter subunit IID [Candidatus Krumholzibacteria bacterium]
MAPVTGKLTRGDLNRIFARTLFLQAAMHRRGMQSLGFLGAVGSGAGRVTGDPAALLARHNDHFNTNPNMAPMVIGGVLRIEEEGGRGGPASVSRFKQACASALAAAGDVFFGGGLRPIALTLATLFAIYRFFPGLVAVFVLYNAALITVRYRGLSFGYARGWGLIEAFSSPRVQRALVLVRTGAACAGGLLAGVIVTGAFQRGTSALATTVGVAALAWLAARRGIPPWRLALAWFPVAWIIARLLH